MRLAEVWLDEYAQYYYQRIGNEKGDFGDVSDRLKLRSVFVMSPSKVAHFARNGHIH